MTIAGSRRASAALARAVLALALVLGLVGSGGCAGVHDGAGVVARYAVARADDLSDCVRISAGMGLGLYADAEATSLLRPSAGFADASLRPHWTAGWDPRTYLTPGEVRTAAFPTMLLAWPFYGAHEVSSGYGDTHPYLRGFVSPFFLMGNEHVRGRERSILFMHKALPNPRLVPNPGEEPPPVPLADHFWVAASGTALVVTADAGLNVLEILDFLAGIVGFDPLGDDDHPEVADADGGDAEEPVTPPPPSPPEEPAVDDPGEGGSDSGETDTTNPDGAVTPEHFP